MRWKDASNDIQGSQFENGTNDGSLFFVCQSIPAEKHLDSDIWEFECHSLRMDVFIFFFCDVFPFLICFLHVLYIFVLFFKCIFFGFSVSLLVWRFFFSSCLHFCKSLMMLLKSHWFEETWLISRLPVLIKTKPMLCFCFHRLQKSAFFVFLRCATLPLSSTLPFIFLILSCF